MFLDSVFEKLTKQEPLYPHLCWPEEFYYFGNSKIWMQMLRINTYMLKMKEGRRIQIWVDALLGLVIGLWRISKPTGMGEKRWRQELTMVERQKWNLKEKAWKLWEKYKKLSTFQDIFYYLRNTEELNPLIKKKNQTADGESICDWRNHQKRPSAAPMQCNMKHLHHDLRKQKMKCL